MFVKVCGLTTPEAIAAAVAAGVDAVGFVFTASPRRVTPDEARELARPLPPHIVRVAVFRHPEPELVAVVRRVLAPDWLQADAEDIAAIELPPDTKTLPVYREGRPPPADAWPPRLLFEGVDSGSGRTADWDEARHAAERAELILAGGLDAANVDAAIARVRPWGVDVSSGVELAKGRKDPRKIHEFVARVRAVEQ
jgi:phosphoribosylanthranilate isomerase